MTDETTTEIDEAHCPYCHSEEGIERVEPKTIPSDRARCTNCGHRTSESAFRDMWKWERLSEAERAGAREAAVSHKP